MRVLRDIPHTVYMRLLVTTLAISHVAIACNVPVYRYALEHWIPQQYEVIVFRHGKDADRNSAENKAIKALSDSGANLVVNEIDADTPTAKDIEEELTGSRDKPLPWMVLRFPEKNGGPARIVASEPFNSKSVAQLLNSPARKEIARHMASGDAAVWIYVDSGLKNVDDAKAAEFDTILAKLSADFKAAAQATQRGTDVDGGAGDLTVDPNVEPAPVDPNAPPAAPAAPVASLVPDNATLALIHLRRNDPEETILLNMLFECDGDFSKRAEGRAAAFLVFGRGRMLISICGDDLEQEKITTANGFLSGPCLCSIKEQNPGWDLLMDADWDKLLTVPADPKSNAVVQPAPATVAVAPGEVAVPSEVKDPPAPSQVKTDRTDSAQRTVSNETGGADKGTLAFAGILIGLGALALLISLKGRRSA